MTTLETRGGWLGCLLLAGATACGGSEKQGPAAAQDSTASSTQGTTSTTGSPSTQGTTSTTGSPSTQGTTSTTGSPSTTTGGPSTTEACGSLTHEQARAIVTTNTEHVLSVASDSLAFIEDSLVLARVLDGAADPITYKADLDQAIADLLDSLETHIMHPDNVSQELGDRVIYELKPEVTCVEPAPNPDDPVAEQDALADYNDCLTSLSETPIGLEVARTACDAGDNVTLKVLVGSERFNPLTLTLLTNELGATVNLEHLISVLQAYADLGPDTTISEDSRGELALTLKAVDTTSAQLSAEVLSAIHWSSTSDGAPTTLDLPETGTALELASTQASQTLSGTLALGQISYGMALDAFVDGLFQRDVPEPGSDPVVVSLAGFHSDIAYDGTLDSLTLTGLGLGDTTTTATYQGSTLLAIDVNAAQNRQLGVVATTSVDEPLRLVIDPGFALDIEYGMAPVASQITDLPNFALDDTVSITLDGQNPEVVLLENVDGYVSLLDDVSGALLAVSSGTLSLTSRTDPGANVSVAPGQCLVHLEQTVGTHELLGALATGSCP